MVGETDEKLADKAWKELRRFAQDPAGCKKFVGALVSERELTIMMEEIYDENERPADRTGGWND